MRKRLLLRLGAALLCLGIMPVTAYAARTEGYEVSTDWVTGTTTYAVTSLEDIYNSSLQPEGDAILDFTECDPLSPGKSESLIINPQKEGAHVTIRGAEDTNYGNVTLDVNGSVAGVTLQDFQTRSSLVNYGGEGTCEIVYDGNCVIDLQLGGADYIVCAADDASYLELGFVSQDKEGSVTISGNLSVESSLRAATMTIGDAFVSFGETYLGSAIVSPQLTIESSTINGVGHINSFEYPSYETVTIDAFDGSFITIDDSQISFDADVGGNSSATVLGNSETITITDSVVSGIEVTSGYGCLGGIFESIVVEGSTVYAKSDYAAAIGPSDSAYGSSGFSKFGFKDPSITIENSVVEAASTYGAAIGMPRLSESYLQGERPTLSVTISGTSNVSATSVRSAAIGASSSKAQSDVDGVEIEVGAGDITWGRSSDANPLGRFLSLLGLADEPSIEDDLAEAAELLSGCTVTISDSPTIRAKSGVMAIYADSVSVTGTNLVQDTMALADRSDEYSVYPMETPGAVMIGSDTIGELGYGYASVAATNVAEQTDVAMTFGGAALTDAEKNVKTFTVSANGFQRFLTTPTLALSGSVSITGATDGVATVNTTLKLDLSELVPSRAATVSAGSYENLTFQWYRDGSEITNATFSTYALTNNDNGKVITCVVTGKGFFEGSVTSNAVLVGSQSTVDAPTLAERTENSITLENAGNGYEYRIVGDGSWQGTTEFTSLDSGATYVFQQKDPSGNVSAPASFSTLSKTPAADDFTIDYVKETLSFPSGVYLYSDATCETCLNKNSSKTSIDISGLISSDEVTLYARYATVDLADTDSVTSVTIPARPEAPALADDALTVTSDSIRFAGAEGVAYRLLTSDRVLQTATGNDQKVAFEGLSPATTYTLEMRVEASNDAPATFRSEVVEKNVMTAAAAPTAPELHALAEAEGDGYDSIRVGFSWERPATNGAVISGYVIYAQAKGSESVQVWSSEGADATSCDVTTGSDSGLQPGGTYTFTLQVSWSAGTETGTVSSTAVTLTLPNLRPDPADFTIGYVDETLTVPSGVSLYKDAGCTTLVDLDDKNVANITPYISESNETPQKLYARFTSAGDDIDAVTEIEIPRRPRVNTISDTWLKPGYDSLRIDAGGYVEGCSYALMLDETVIEPSQSNNTRTLYEGLMPGTTYSLVITKPADDTSFKSSITQEITTKKADKKTSDLLVPAASRLSWEAVSYDLSDLLDDAEIKGVNKVEDNDYILNYAIYDTSGKKAVKLQLRSTSVGESATVEVEAQYPGSGDYLVITLTLEVVDVMAEGSDGVYWVRTDLTEDEATGVESVLKDILDGASLLGTFDLKPLNPVGGAAVDDAASTQVTWKPSDGTQAQGAYEVYRISDDAAAKLENVSQTDSGITFMAEGTGGSYAVVFRPTTSPEVTYTVTIASQGIEHGSFSASAQQVKEGDTVTITATPETGYELASVSVTAADDTDVTVENLSFTMPASSVTVSGAFTPIKPEAPALSASYDAEKNAVEVSWTLESNGAVITGYSLAVTSSGNPINGSPFSPNSNATSYELTGLAPGTYELTLTATNNGVSTDSNTVTVTVPEPVAPTYNVNVATVEHGSFLASPTTAKEGDPVIITATPDEGYETASVTVTGTDDDAVSVAPQQDGTYTFTMPASDVIVSGTFRAVAGEDDPDEGDLNALLEKAFKDGDDFDAITLKSGTYELTADLSVAELAEGNENLKTTSLYVGNGTEDATVELDLAGRTLNTDDCALIVLKGSTLTIVDSVGGGSISGRNGLSFTGDDGTKYAYAGGVAVYGTLNLKSGSISGNQASGDGVLGYGGGVYVFGGGVFNMYGGTISGNTASTQGGGVAVRSAADTTPVPEPLYVGDAVIEDWNEVEGDDVVAELSVGLLSADSQTVSGSSDGTFNLYGGTISGNTAPVAGGIYAGGVVTIGADSTTPTAVTVSDNTSGNLYVPADTAVELSATPASGSKVGVTMEKAPGLFASSDSEVASSSRASFTSDNGAYYVVTRQDGLALAYVPAPTYRPEIEVPGGGGTVTTDPRYPEQGDEVTIVPEPDEGKVVGTVEVVDKNGEPVEVIDNGDGTWTYRQPAGTVTITVTFVCDGGELCPSAHLVDVDQSQWYHLAIDWAVTNGVMNGYDDGVTFGPNDSLTRAQMACVLYNLAGKPEVDASSLPADCVLGSWYARAVAWALDEGVFNGYGDGSAFGPDDPLTREQAACMLINAARRLGVDTSARENLSAYPDADEVSSWARNALSWAVAEGVVNGVEVEGGRELQPGRACTRAEMAALMRNLALCA